MTANVPRKNKRQRKHAGSDSSFESIKSLQDEMIMNDFNTVVKATKKGKKKKKKRMKLEKTPLNNKNKEDLLDLQGTIDPDTSKKIV
jgi:hypothetical protein